MNTIQPGSFLTLHYRLAGPDGADVVTTFNDQPATLTLGAGQLAPAFEAKLLGLEEGTRASFTLAPGEAFGERNPEMVQRVGMALLRELGDPDETWRVAPAPADLLGRYHAMKTAALFRLAAEAGATAAGATDASTSAYAQTIRQLMKPPCDLPAAKIRLGSTHRSARRLATSSRTNAVFASRFDCAKRQPIPPSGVARMKPSRSLIAAKPLTAFCCSGLLMNP